MLLTIVLADVVSVVSPMVFVENNLVVVYAQCRTPVIVSVVKKV